MPAVDYERPGTAARGPAPLVSLRNIAMRFGAIHALRNVSLDLRHSDVVGLVGDNGAGKSTLVKILAGAQEPTSGDIILDGAPCILSPPAQAQRLGVETVYQDLALIGPFTIAENFFLGREMAVGKGPALLRLTRRGAMTEAASRALDDLNITISRARTLSVDKLSGGQRQLVAIARAAFWGSKLLLLDEPTAALGVRESAEVLRLINRLSQRGLTILMVTHNLEHLWSVCNRVVTFRRGAKVADMASRDTDMDEVVAYITGAKGEREFVGAPAVESGNA